MHSGDEGVCSASDEENEDMDAYNDDDEIDDDDEAGSDLDEGQKEGEEEEEEEEDAYHYNEDSSVLKDSQGEAGPSTSSGSSRGSDKGFKTLSIDKVRSTIERLISEVKDLIQVDNDQAEALLLSFKWDKDQLVEQWFVSPSEVALKAGLPDPASSVAADKNEAEEEVECPICMSDCGPTERYTLTGCGHTYCNDCWAQYIKTKFEEGAECVFGHCPFPKCKMRCTRKVFQKFLGPQNYDKYCHYMVTSFIDLSNQRKWCPTPGCEQCVEVVLANTQKPVECRACGYRFCFLCNDFEIGDHAPASCEEVTMWLKKLTAESENVKWLDAHTKACPKCHSHIEKNGGCMHMTCKKCAHEFCWLCRGNWRGHSACNKSEEVINEERRAKAAQTELKHYMFFFHRYESYRNATKIATAQRKAADLRRMELAHLLDVSFQDTLFISEATEQLLRNRNMLQYSYVYAYYLSEKRVRAAEKNLFEYLQKDLEVHTDKLSHLYEIEGAVERILTLNDFLRWKEAVANYIRICKKFLENFVDGVIEKTLTHQEGAHMTEEERFYVDQLEQLAAMGFTDTSFLIPLLTKYDGRVDAVLNVLFG